MNRRKFLKYLGFGAAVVATPVLANLSKKTGLSALEGEAVKVIADGNVGPEMTATEVKERRDAYWEEFRARTVDPPIIQMRS